MTAVQDWLAGIRTKPGRGVGLALAVFYVIYTFLNASDFGQFFNFTVIGIADGCVFAIAASGLVLTYATTGVFNFAHGGVGMISAYLYFTLSRDMSLPVPIALVLVLFVFAPLMGIAIELVMRRFKDAAVQTTVVVTIALTVLLIGVAQKFYPPKPPKLLPRLIKGDALHFFSARPLPDDVLHLVLAVAVAVSLRFLLFGSRTGTAMRAVVDNPDLAALNGAPPVTIARYSWMLGSVLAALAGILLASGTNLEPITLTFFVAGAYGCAVVGKLKSLPLTFAGAIALGIIKHWSEIKVPTAFGFPSEQVANSLRTAIPGLFLFFALLLVPAAKLTVGRVVGTRAPTVPSLRSSLVRGGVFVGVMLLVSRVAPTERLPDLTRGVIYAVLLVSLMLLTGFSGQVSLCQYVFMAVGAWAMGSYFGGHSIFGIVLAGLVAMPLGAIVALPALRLQGLYLALVTFGFAIVSKELVLDNPRIFGDGNIAVGRLKLLGIDFSAGRSFFFLCGIVFALVSVLVLILKRGPFGRRLAALRDSQAACATLGLDTRRTKLVVFALSASIAGVAGALFGGFNTTAGTIQFEPINNIVLMLFAVVGGITTVSGALIGGMLFSLLPYVQSEYPDQAGLVFALVAVAAIGLGRQPNGLAGMIYDRFAFLAPKRAPRRVAPTTPSPQEVTAGASA